jgi:hypothetical protein
MKTIVLKKYEVLKETNTSSELLDSFDDLKEAQKLAEIEVKNTDPENENEGINIYYENEMILSYYKDELYYLKLKS